MIYFLDASAWVMRYVAEPGTQALRALLARRIELAASRLSAVEVPAALARRARDGHLPDDTARSIAARLLHDLGAARIVEPRTRVVELASDLVWRRPLRGYDALQLASALHLARETRQSVTFVCSDRSLCDAAVAEGVRKLALG